MRHWPRQAFRPAAQPLTQPRRAIALQLVLLAATALLTRWGTFGNAALLMDEQFYLVAATKLLHGSLPYVDIWDRKPIGLWLIYAVFAAFGSKAIIACQIGALLSVVATAFVIRRIALRYTDGFGASLCAMAYIVCVPALGGAGGQSPVFYNLPVAIAAWLCIGADDPRHARRRGCIAMLLIGLAIQIKYTALIEGIGFGLWLLWQAWRREARAMTVAREAVLLVMLALTPTLAAILFFAAKGAFAAFAYANFISIFRVDPPAGFSSGRFLLDTLVKLAPLLVAWAVSMAMFLRPFRRSDDALLLLWTGFAGLGFFAIGNFYDHYALPLLVPLLLGCGRLLAFRLLGPLVLLCLLGSGGDLLDLKAARVRTDSNSAIAHMVAAVTPEARTGCLYINDGPTIVYLLARACTVTPYLFPEHLNNAAEGRATGATIEMARLLARRPAIIMVASRDLDHPRNRETSAMLDAALHADYVLRAQVPDIYPNRVQNIFVRLAARRSPI